jgi:hypothetical protein
MPDDELQQCAQDPQSHHYAKPFRLALQETINSFKQLPSSVPQKTQLLIRDSLHTFHAAGCIAMFARKADETEEEKNKRWGTFKFQRYLAQNYFRHVQSYMSPYTY